MRSRLVQLAIVAAAIPLIACADTEPVGPAAGTPLDLSSPALAPDHEAPVIVQELGIMDIAGQGLSGSVTLTRSVDGLSADLVVTGLIPGYAYSLWWAVFNNPQGCDAPCEAFDLRNIRQAQGSLVNGGGFVGTGGTIVHSTSLARHDPQGKSVEAGDPRGVRNPFGAEVHLVIRSHGPAESEAADLERQITTFGEFCNLPVVGCLNVGASPFPPPHAPGR